MNGASGVRSSQPTQQKPLLSPSEARSDAPVLASMEPKVGRPLGERIRAFFQRVFSRNRASEGSQPLAKRPLASGTPLPSREQVAAQTATKEKVGDLLKTVANTGENGSSTGNQPAVHDALKDVQRAMRPLVNKSRGPELVFRESVRAEVAKMEAGQVQAMYINLNILEAESGKTGSSQVKDPASFRLLKLELLARVNPAEAQWLEKFGSPKPATPGAVLTDPKSRELLGKFLDIERSSENLKALDFLDKALEEKDGKTVSPLLLKESAQVFLLQFGPRGETEVNISGPQRDAVTDAAKGKPGADVRVALSAVHVELTKLMTTDSIPRFLNQAATLEGLS